MKLRHATPSRNLASINRRGLLTAKSQGRLPVVWLHTASRSPWAVLHTVRQHSCKVVLVLEIDVPRSLADAEQGRLVVHEPRCSTGPDSTNHRGRRGLTMKTKLEEALRLCEEMTADIEGRYPIGLIRVRVLLEEVLTDADAEEPPKPAA